MDFQSNCWVNLRILGQPCEFYLHARGDRRGCLDRRGLRSRALAVHLQLELGLPGPKFAGKAPSGATRARPKTAA
jgi:hypothetical protein